MSSGPWAPEVDPDQLLQLFRSASTGASPFLGSDADCYPRGDEWDSHMLLGLKTLPAVTALGPLFARAAPVHLASNLFDTLDNVGLAALLTIAGSLASPTEIRGRGFVMRRNESASVYLVFVKVWFDEASAVGRQR